MSLIDVLVPDEQEGTKAVVRSWMANVGDRISADAPLVELETDKVTQEVPSPVAGVLAEIILSSDAEALPGALLARIDTSVQEDKPVPTDRKSAKDAPTGSAKTTKPDATTEPKVTGLSPAVRRALKQYNLDPAGIEGTGRGGRITREDVKRVANETSINTLTQAAPTPPPPKPAQTSPLGGATSVPHSRMRLTIAQNMLHSVTIAPHVSAVFECDMSAIFAHRAARKSAFQARGIPLTYTAYFMAAAAEAMKVAPAINSRWYDDRLDLFDDVNIGVGTALGDEGLVVPVVHRCQTLSLEGVAHRLAEVVGRARQKQLKPADMRDGTFTISNHGVSGSLLATPIIINQPQSAILGIGKTEKRVVVKEVDGVDTIQIRPMAYVTLTIDHRAVDGHQTNAWLSRFVEIIENWK